MLQHVGDTLHQETVLARAAIHEQASKARRRLRAHGGEDVMDLKGDGIGDGAGHLGTGGAEIDLREQGARIGIPIGCSKANEGRHETGTVWLGGGGELHQRGDIRQAENLRHPGQGGCRNENIALEGEGGFAAEPPCDGGGDAAFGRDEMRQGCHDRRAGAEGYLAITRIKGAMAEEGGVAVADGGEDRRAVLDAGNA